MKDPDTPRTGRAGFTLLELLTVIVVIGILAGILFPVLGKSKDRALELAAKQLCAETAAAWTTLALNNHRFPSKALLVKYGTSVTASGGDLTFGMDTGIASVLNWWSAKVPVPEGDVKYFKPRYVMGTSRNQEISEFSNLSPEDVQCWPADQLFERSVAQKCFGVYAPWVERRLAACLSDAADGSLEDAGDPNAILQKSGDWLVCAAIDYDGDGRVTLPEDIAALAGLSKEDKDLPMTAAAWVWSMDKRRLLTSW